MVPDLGAALRSARFRHRSDTLSGYLPVTSATPKTMKIGELAKASGCHAQSIRHYEYLGVLPPSRRTQTGHRRYDNDDVGRLKFVRSARDQGLPLATIRDLLERLRPTP